MAIGSTLEVAACVRVINDLHYIEEQNLDRVDELTKELYFKLLKFNNYLKKHE